MKKVLNAIRLHSSISACRQCVHFQNDPATVEKAYPGLKIMSSGYASVRDCDGFCDLHQLYLSGRDGCAAFQPLDPDSIGN
jgi:hypothetical protein